MSSASLQLLRHAAASFMFILVASICHAGTIDPSRMPADGWAGQVGIPGGIPTNYVQYCNVRTSIPGTSLLAKADGVTDDSSAINYAVQHCPNNQYVYIPGGTYRLQSTILRQGATTYYKGDNHPYSILIKGDGPSQTRLIYTGTSGSVIQFLPASGSVATMPVISGNTRGSNRITVNTVSPYLGVNSYITIHRINAEATLGLDAGYMIDTASQIVKVTAVDTSAKTITFTPALNEGHPSDFVSLPASSAYRSGVQDLYIENTTNNGGHNIHISNGQECWIKNVESNMAAKWHFRLQTCARCEVRECFVHDGFNGGGDSIYGVGLIQYSCNNLIENNVAVRCRHAYILEWGGQGNVFGYNYSKDPLNEGGLATDYLMGDLILHGGTQRFNLFEGNVAATIRFDAALGASESNTVFRNRLQRKGLAATKYACFGSDIQRWNYSANLVGNVYETPATATQLRRWGTNQDDASSIDAVSQSSAYIDGETDLTTGTTTWAGADHTLPGSYYLSSKPYFFGSASWPLIGPEFKSIDPSVVPAVIKAQSLNIAPAAPNNVKVILSGTN